LLWLSNSTSAHLREMASMSRGETKLRRSTSGLTPLGAWCLPMSRRLRLREVIS
jgi:hypothetical protein